eukprot:1450-Heterococcus_DN1.PRE.1
MQSSVHNTTASSLVNVTKCTNTDDMHKRRHQTLLHIDHTAPITIDGVVCTSTSKLLTLTAHATSVKLHNRRHQMVQHNDTQHCKGRTLHHCIKATERDCKHH